MATEQFKGGTVKFSSEAVNELNIRHTKTLIYVASNLIQGLGKPEADEETIGNY